MQPVNNYATQGLPLKTMCRFPVTPGILMGDVCSVTGTEALFSSLGADAMDDPINRPKGPKWPEIV